MATSNTTTNKARLTRSRIDNFVCAPGEVDSYLWDQIQPGLGVRAYSTGKKSYVFRATVNGKTKKATIGAATGDLEQARQEARRLQTLADQGISPTEDKHQRKAKQQAEQQQQAFKRLTIAELWSAYLQANQKNWSDRHYTDHLKAIQEPGLPCGRGLKQKTKAGALWSLKDIPVCDLTSRHLTDWLDRESESRPGIAALAYRLLFACLNWSQEHPDYLGLVDVSTLKTRALKQALPKNKTRTGALEKEQLKSWFSEMRKIKNPVIAAFAQMLLITGARRGELEHLKWEDVDFQWHSLTIRDKATTKGKDIGTRVIPLTQYANTLLQAIPRRNEWVFSSPTSTSGRMTEPRKSIDPALIAAGLDGLTLHDLRRSFATLSEWIEVPAGITAQIMGHKPSATAEKHYKRRPLDLLKQWHNRIEGWMLEQAGIEQPGYSEAPLRVVS